MIEKYGSLSEKIFKKGFWLYLFSFIMAPIGYIIKIILSTDLSPGELGIIYGIISLVTILSSFNDFGLTESLKHFIASYVSKNRYDKIKSMLAYAFLMQMLTSFIIAGIFYFGAEIIALKHFDSKIASDSIKIFSLFFIGINLFQIITTFLIGVQDTFWSKLTDLVRLFFSLTFILAITLTDMGSLVIYSWGWIFGLYLGVLFGAYIFFRKYYFPYLSKEKTLWNKKLFKKIFKYALLVFLSSQAGTILSQVDMQMILYMLGNDEAGYYTVYISMIGMPFLLITPIFQLLLPLFSELYFTKKIDQIIKLKGVLYKLLTVVGITTGIFLFTFYYQISYILFGREYVLSGEIIKYSSLFLVFNLLLQVNFNILASIGKVTSRLVIIILGIFFNIFLNIIFINEIGVYGAALSTGMGWLFIWVLSENFLGVKYSVKIDYKLILKNIVIMGLIGKISYNVVSNFRLGRLHTFCLIILFFLIWCIAFILVNYKDSKIIMSEVERLRNLKRKT